MLSGWELIAADCVRPGHPETWEPGQQRYLKIRLSGFDTHVWSSFQDFPFDPYELALHPNCEC